MKTISLLLILLALCGCSITPTTEQLAQQEQFRQTIPVCYSALQCERMWSAARRWVLDHSGFKIQHYSSDYMETFNTRDSSETSVWARVTKEPTQGDSYKILIELDCNNPFGCGSSLAQSRIEFNHYVSNAGGN